MSFIPKPHEIYKHFKGNLYQIVALAEHTETGETLVIYQALYGEGKIYARELSMFTSPVDREKYPDVVQEMRFELQETTIDPQVLEFLDAESYAQKLDILNGLHYRITDEMITTMAISCDVAVEDGDTQKRYQSLKNCLITLEKFECNRLRQ